MKKVFLFILLLFVISGSVFAQILLKENFEYGTTTGSLVDITGNWTSHSGTSGKVGYTPNGLVMDNYSSSSTIGAATFLNNNDEDVNRTFTAQTTGITYVAFLLNMSNNSTQDKYIFHFNGADNHAARFFTTKGSVAGKIKFGITKTAASTTTYASSEFDANTTYLVILKYDFVAGLNNDNVSLYVLDKVLDNEPTTPIATANTNESDATSLSAFSIRQMAGTGSGMIDAITVAKTWQEVLGITPKPVLSSDASLQKILVSNTEIPNFSPSKFLYSFEIQSTLPTITSIPNSATARQSITIDSQQAIIEVFAQDNSTSSVYKIQFIKKTESFSTLSKDASLQKILVNNSELSNFSPSVFVYSFQIESTLPVITSIPNSSTARQSITIDSQQAIIEVVAQDNTTTNIYKIVFTKTNPISTNSIRINEIGESKDLNNESFQLGYIELYNTSDLPVDLSNYRLFSKSSNEVKATFSFTANTTIEPHGFLLIARNKTTFLEDYPTIDSRKVIDAAATISIENNYNYVLVNSQGATISQTPALDWKGNMYENDGTNWYKVNQLINKGTPNQENKFLPTPVFLEGYPKWITSLNTMFLYFKTNSIGTVYVLVKQTKDIPSKYDIVKGNFYIINNLETESTATISNLNPNSSYHFYFMVVNETQSVSTISAKSYDGIILPCRCGGDGEEGVTVNETETTKTLIYPNPCENEISISNTMNIKQIEIYSSFGIKVQTITTNFQKIDVSDLKSGLYLMKIRTNEGKEFTEKVLKR